MAIKIGHASIDEYGKTVGGEAGDQTKKEVCIRTYYKASWDAVLRPKSAEVAEKSAKFVEEACVNDKVGYDQGQRNTLYAQAVPVSYDASAIKVKCECDCSSLVHVAAMAGGAKLTYGNNGFTTRTMIDRLVASGDYEKLTDSKFLTSDKHLKRGDILVNVGSHTVMVLEDGSGVASAKPAITTATSTSVYSQKQFIMDVQAAIGAKVDGIVGNETLSKTVTISRYKNSKHPVVKAVQRYLNLLGYNCGTVDGIAGALFDAAVKKYQKATGCTVDGEITAKNKTWKLLLGISSVEVKKEAILTVGSKVKVKKGAKWTNGATPKSFVFSNIYDVISIDGEKIRIGKGKAVTGTIHKDNLIVQ